MCRPQRLFTMPQGIVIPGLKIFMARHEKIFSMVMRKIIVLMVLLDGIYYLGAKAMISLSVVRVTIY